MTATTVTVAAVPTATVAAATDAKPKTDSKKTYKAHAPSAPPQDTEKGLVYVRCKKCSGGRAKIQFYHVVSLCVLFFVAYALLSVAAMLNDSIEDKVSDAYVKTTKYNELKQNYTFLHKMYNGLQKEVDALKNKPEEPKQEKRDFTLKEDNTFIEIPSHIEGISEIESTTQTETRIEKEDTTEKGAEEVTSNTDEEEKNVINIPSQVPEAYQIAALAPNSNIKKTVKRIILILPSLLWFSNNKDILDKIRLCIESRIC